MEAGPDGDASQDRTHLVDAAGPVVARGRRTRERGPAKREYPVYFALLGEICDIETIAVGNAIRDVIRLRARYGAARWRKLKGIARVRVAGGRTRRADIRWYEAHGVGRVRMKLKRFLD